ncbi:MAG: response regulator [Myxococcales bacterium]|nr:response regulator [Myxococcales bacterium]
MSEPWRLLVVDDERLVARVLARMLAPHEVEVVASVAEARERLTATRFDAVFSDLLMPQENGLDLHDWLRQEHPALAERFVLVTGGVTDPALSAEVEARALSVLSKPLRRDDVRAFLTALGAG